MLTLAQFIKEKGGVVRNEISSGKHMVEVRLGGESLKVEGPLNMKVFRVLEAAFEAATGLSVCPVDTSSVGFNGDYYKNKYNAGLLDSLALHQVYLDGLDNKDIETEPIVGNLASYISGEKLDAVLITEVQKPMAYRLLDSTMGDWEGLRFNFKKEAQDSRYLDFFRCYKDLEDRVPCREQATASVVPDGLVEGLRWWLITKKKTMSANEREAFNWAHGRPLSKKGQARIIDLFMNGRNGLQAAYDHFARKATESGVFREVNPVDMRQFFYSQIGRLSSSLYAELNCTELTKAYEKM